MQTSVVCIISFNYIDQMIKLNIGESILLFADVTGAVRHLVSAESVR